MGTELSDGSPAALLAWLASRKGVDLLAEAGGLPSDRLTRLTRLRRRYPADLATAAVELLELRVRARRKFARAESMFFTAEGLEQATGDRIAAYRATRFPHDVPILDACCGIGGDAAFLAGRGPVVAVDRSPAAAVCARANVAVTAGEAGPRVRIVCADVTTLDLARLRAQGVRAAFFDPSRRLDTPSGERRRVRAATDYAPPLAWLEALRVHFPFLGVKVSPAIDDDTLGRTEASVEFLSDRGECKEAVLWFEPATDALPVSHSGTESSYHATILCADKSYSPLPTHHSPLTSFYRATVLCADRTPATLAPFACDPPPIAAPRAWLYEPDPAVIRAHLLPQVASLLNAAQVDLQIAYLTADTYISTPFATAYRVLEWLPFHVKNVQARLRALGRRVEIVKRRGVPLEPEEMRARLGGAAGDLPVVVVLTRMAQKPIAILCDPPSPR